MTLFQKAKHINRGKHILFNLTSANSIGPTVHRFNTKGFFTTRPHNKKQGTVDEWAQGALNKKEEFVEKIYGKPLVYFQSTVSPLLPQTYPVPKITQAREVEEGTELPLNSHLLYFLPNYTEHELSLDGYNEEESPPEPYNQRVWAGGSLTFSTENPLRVGHTATLVSQIDSVKEKYRPIESGGPLIMVGIKREVFNENGLSITERRELAYMEKMSPARKNVKPKNEPDFQHSFVPSNISLFRYSALTWNSHLIHYDFNYANKVEKHPNLLVHGPLTCTLLLENLRCNLPTGYKVHTFSYRAVSPLYVKSKMTLCGKWNAEQKQMLDAGDRPDQLKCELWAINDEDGLAMQGTATLKRVSL
ncbi:Mesaconyl-C(4)-CoA hydratase [Zancudomyces culisetae]|uniref:Mesaconyl-C(4)-CoA hydratase n=1 Tax=Zancudomyces culisetae TaxID=1213189 RepID=A0A1R1PX61_ZANCU|nr:Mesaconyl-C(4)-CoA hydratase [Zancudomyces culisetae]|eukprot:OMH85585.1 Mesaconyl-C(4)-CoA hydratase [Zancudomyces culisetae]